MRLRLTSAAILLAILAIWPAATPTEGAAAVPSDAAAVEHALNRLTFGPRPGDVERVQRLGLAAWLDEQLHPERLPEPKLDAPEPRPASFDSQQAARQWGRQQVTALSAAKLTRVVTSERQLEELLVDFWFNHFNVFAGKARTSIFVTEYEQEAIRPHVFGRFRDLLGATAKSPAMLIYLDNRQSSVRGLNENYGRELLELHTLGVDGGYTQADVTEVARAFTGWTIDPRTQGFRFAPRLHDEGSKKILGQSLNGRGIAEGERVLDMLAAHPATARHIARKLAQRLVADEPPAALVNAAAAKFTQTNGDLREVVRTIVTSPDFFSPAVRGVKVKTPLEFVASALRARDTKNVQPQRWLRALQQLGMPLYMCQPPTGYDITAESWVSSGALVNRMNVAVTIGDSKYGLPEFQRR